MGKRLGSTNVDDYDYYLALQAINQNNYVPEDDVVLSSKIPSPEEITIKNDLFRKMSEEAMDVIAMIFEAPVELVEELSNLIDGPWLRPMKSRDDKIFTLRRIKCYLRKCYGFMGYKPSDCKNQIDLIIDEMKNFSRDIEIN